MGERFDVGTLLGEAQRYLSSQQELQNKVVRITLRASDVGPLMRFLDRDLRRRRKNYLDGRVEEFPAATREDVNSVLLENFRRDKSKDSVNVEISLREATQVNLSIFGQAEQLGPAFLSVLGAIVNVEQAILVKLGNCKNQDDKNR